MKKIASIGLMLLLSTVLSVQAQSASGGDYATDTVTDAEVSSCTSLTVGMVFGSRDSRTGGQVTDLQVFLGQQGLLSSEPTGYFGNGTLAAVKSFQSRNGITPNGQVGPLTRAKIKSVSCGGATTGTGTGSTYSGTPATPYSGTPATGSGSGSSSGGSAGAGTSAGTAAYVSYLDGAPFSTGYTSKENALARCLSVAADFKTRMVRCTWGGTQIYSSTGSTATTSTTGTSNPLGNYKIYIDGMPSAAVLLSRETSLARCKATAALGNHLTKSIRCTWNDIEIYSRSPIVTGTPTPVPSPTLKPTFTVQTGTAGLSSLRVQFDVKDGLGVCENTVPYSVEFGDGEQGSMYAQTASFATTYASGGTTPCAGYFNTHTYKQAGTYTAKLYKQAPMPPCPAGAACTAMMPAPEVVGTLTVTVGSSTPSPTNGVGSCNKDGTMGTISWTAPSGWNTFYTRVRVPVDEANMGAPAWDDNFVGTTKTFPTTPGKTYSWWVHTKNTTDGTWSKEISGQFKCADLSSTNPLGNYKIYIDGMPSAAVLLSRETSLARCKATAALGNHLTKSIRCTWNDIEIYSRAPTLYSPTETSGGAVFGASISGMCTDLTNRMLVGSTDGSSNGDVSSLQSFLVAQGYMGEVTGYFGTVTENAVKSFQNDKSLIVTGVVGQVTRDTIKNISCY